MMGWNEHFRIREMNYLIGDEKYEFILLIGIWNWK